MDVFFNPSGKYQSQSIEKVLRFRCAKDPLDLAKKSNFEPSYENIRGAFRTMVSEISVAHSAVAFAPRDGCGSQ